MKEDKAYTDYCLLGLAGQVIMKGLWASFDEDDEDEPIIEPIDDPMFEYDVFMADVFGDDLNDMSHEYIMSLLYF